MPCKLLNPNELAVKAEYVRRKPSKREGTGLKNVRVICSWAQSKKIVRVIALWVHNNKNVRAIS